MVFDKPITIEVLNEKTEQWRAAYKLHARINKARGAETFEAGSSRSKATRTFEIRYFKAIEEIDGNTQIFRIVYNDKIYNIVDYDDFMENHQTVKLTGEYYGDTT